MPWEELHEAFVDADVVLTCTGSLGYVVKADALADAAEATPGRVARRAIVDLALPRDVDPDVALLPRYANDPDPVIPPRHIRIATALSPSRTMRSTIGSRLLPGWFTAAPP